MKKIKSMQITGWPCISKTISVKPCVQVAADLSMQSTLMLLPASDKYLKVSNHYVTYYEMALIFRHSFICRIFHGKVLK